RKAETASKPGLLSLCGSVLCSSCLLAAHALRAKTPGTHIERRARSYRFVCPTPAGLRTGRAVPGGLRMARSRDAVDILFPPFDWFQHEELRIPLGGTDVDEDAFLQGDMLHRFPKIGRTGHATRSDLVDHHAFAESLGRRGAVWLHVADQHTRHGTRVAELL